MGSSGAVTTESGNAYRLADDPAAGAMMARVEQFCANVEALQAAFAARTYRIGAVTILASALGLNQVRDVPVTWSTAMPTPAYNVDIPPATEALLGRGTAAQYGPLTAGGMTVRVTCTSLLGLSVGTTFPVIAWI